MLTQEERRRLARQKERKAEMAVQAVGCFFLALYFGFCLLVALAILKLAIWIIFGW